ncbi:MAG: patatin family protein [Bacilli bacterium]|jgi:predicted patatin/cPLA2 family phospholipase|nr:patatin family protein [Bacilli bacterium]
MTTKLALVIQGGGTRGAYASGVLDVLMERGIWADAVYGTSAGALCGVGYVSRDMGRSDRMFVGMNGELRFVKPLNLLLKGSAIDFDDMFFGLSRRQLPFDADTFFSSKTEFYVCATSCESGEAVYFSKLDPEFWDGLAASASLPLATKPRLVRGRPYLDGGIVVPVALPKALEDGAKKVIVVLTREKGYRKKPLSSLRKRIANLMYGRYHRFMRAYRQSNVIYNKEMDRVDRFVEEGKAFAIYPEIPPRIGHVEKDKSKIQALIDAGRKDALKAFPALKEYLSK